MDKIYTLFAYRMESFWQRGQEEFHSETNFFESLSYEEVCEEIAEMILDENRFNGDSCFTFYLQSVEGGKIKTVEFDSGYSGDDEEIKVILSRAAGRAEILGRIRKAIKENERKAAEMEQQAKDHANRLALFRELYKEFGNKTIIDKSF